MFHASHLTFHPFTPIIYNILGGIAFELSNYFALFAFDNLGRPTSVDPTYLWEFFGSKEFGFPYFYIRGEFLLSLTSGTSFFFFLSHIRTPCYTPKHVFKFQRSLSNCNGVQRESPVRPGLCLLQLDRSSCQLRPLDEHRLGR